MQDKDITTKTDESDGMHMPHKRFSRIYILSNVVVVIIMISVTFFIDYVHQQALAVADKKEEAPKIMKVAAVGDSITHGTPHESATSEENSYPTQLQLLLGRTYKVYNYGLSGSTLLSTGDQPYVTDDIYEQSQALQPDIVLIMLGTNDSKGKNWNAETYSKELSAFVNRYKNLASKPKVYLMTTPPVFDTHTELSPDDFNKSTVRNQIVPTIRHVAKVTNVPLIDIYEALKSRRDLFIDGVHPTLGGSKAIAETVRKAIRLASNTTIDNI